MLSNHFQQHGYKVSTKHFHEVVNYFILLLSTTRQLERFSQRNEMVFQRRGSETRLFFQIGVRFFDLRVAKHKESGSIHVVHGLMGKKLNSHLEEIKSFLDQHKKEVIFIYFQK